MTTQLPDLITSMLPLILSMALVMAVLGLVSSLAALILRNKPVVPTESRSFSRSINWLQGSRPIKLASAVFWMIITGLHLLAWNLYFGHDSKYQLHVLSYISSFIAILLAWQLCQMSFRTDSGGSRISALGMRLLQVVGLACCSSLLVEGPSPVFPQIPPGELVVCDTARTDQGTPIPLYDRQIEPGQLEEFYVATHSELSNMTRLAMFREQAGPEINCHGWVFSGRHSIKGEDVPTILKENAYQEVEQPKLNDLVLYTDAYGVALHTGLVCGFLGEGTPLIQSKWGITGIYVHLVEEQPYSPSYTFYRSARNGHELRPCEPESQNHDIKLAALWTGEPCLAD